MNQQILRLSGDEKGLLVRIKSMDKNSFWHVHSNEMTSYQQRVHKRLLGGSSQ